MVSRMFPALAVLLLAGALVGCSSSGTGATPPPAVVAPAITAQPVSLTVWAPAPATFTVAVTGTEPLLFQWTRNGTDIPGATFSTFNTGATSVTDHGAVFRVRVSNSAGSQTSTSATLGVNQLPFITQQPDDVVTVEGQSVTFIAAAQGTPVLQYQWKRNGASIPGATSATYTLPSVTRADNLATFKVVVSNSLGTVETREATLQVGAQVAAPLIVQQPLGGHAAIGQSLTFSVTASGTPPLQYQWRKNGSALAGATLSTYTIDNLQASHAGSYSVVVSNSGGSVTSADAVLVVDLSPPAITTQPVDTWAGTGQSATFTVVAAGSPPLQYQWRRNGADIAGATAASYTTPVAVLADHGTIYQVRITNPAGTVLSLEAVLRVYQARTINGLAGTFWQVESGQTFVPRDLRTTAVEALQLGGTGDYEAFPGSGAADGTFQVPGLPPGPFLMVLGASATQPPLGLWVVQGDPDFRDAALGRTDRTYPTSDQTSFAVNVTGALRGLTQGIWVYFPTFALMQTTGGTGPVYRFPWKGLPLSQSSKDILWTLSPRVDSLPEGELTTLAAAASQAAPNMKAIGETLVDAAPATLPRLPGPAVAVTTSAYAAQLSKVHPSLGPVTGRGPLKVVYGVQPGGGTLGAVPPWAPIYTLVRTATADLPSTSFTCSDPFPGTWTRVFSIRQEFSLTLAVPGAAPLVIADALEDLWPADMVTGAPLVPQIHPVVQARINGADLFATSSGVGTAPLLTWQLQVPDVPSYYRITVFRVVPEEGRLEEKISYLTGITSQKVSPGILEAGKSYVFRIQCVRAGGYDPNRPFLPSWPLSTAPVYSGVITP